MGNIIEVSGLSKNYGQIEAVKNIDFSVNEGDLFAFLGTNGAGKSTTIDILCTLIKSDKGRILIDGEKLGENDHKIRSRIGVVFQHSVLDDLLTVKENLNIRASFYGMRGRKLTERTNNIVRICQLEEFFKRPYGKLSGGQKRRADIARALIHVPKILFLDEPTTGLDPNTRKNIWDTVVNMQKEYGTTIFLTTHYMEEAKNADYITIINRGTIIETGTPAYFKNRYTKNYLKLYDPDEKLSLLLNERGIAYHIENDVIVISADKITFVLKLLNDIQHSISSFEYVKGSIDDAFIWLSKMSDSTENT